VNWFASQHRLKLKSVRPIAENRLIAETKLKIARFFKTFEDLIRSFLPEVIFSTDETMMDMNKACTSVLGESYAEGIERIWNNLRFGTSRV
jgi:hypothetical protein